MTSLYITADQIGKPNHGGGSVTWNESQALASLGPCEVWGRQDVRNYGPIWDEPWHSDKCAAYKLWQWKAIADEVKANPGKKVVRDFDLSGVKLAQFYAGTFSDTVRYLKDKGVRISYTAAAHDVAASRREHQLLGIPYDYPHLTDPSLWKRYLAGYKAADVLICPSTHSADVMREFGCTNRIEIIPHGVDLPLCPVCDGQNLKWKDPKSPDKWLGCRYCNESKIAPIAPLPERFTVGYLGAIGPDKGLRYLIEAWGKLAYKDAVLVIAGRDSTHPFVQQMINQWGGNANFNLMGWVDDVSTFYNQLSLYVQPSVTEGFGIEVLEAMSFGRPVVCSRGAGAWGLVIPHWDCRPADAEGLAAKIDAIRTGYGHELEKIGDINRTVAGYYTWDKIREKYVKLLRN